MSRVVSMRLRDEQMQRLQRLARRLGRTPSETAAILVEEGMREAEFAYIQFRDSPVGRQPYIQGTRLAVWQVISLARAYNGDVDKTAEHLVWLPAQVQAALNYAAAFPGEIEAAIEDNHKGFDELKRILPNIELFEVGSDETDRAGETSESTSSAIVEPRQTP